MLGSGCVCVMVVGVTYLLHLGSVVLIILNLILDKGC